MTAIFKTTIVAGVAAVAMTAAASAAELRLGEAQLDSVTAGQLTVIELGGGQFGGQSLQLGAGAGGEFLDINLQANEFGSIEFVSLSEGSLFAPPPPPPVVVPPIGGGGGGLGGLLGFLAGLLGG